MKLRNFIIVLLAVFMVFAFASCKNEPVNPTPGPGPEPGPGPDPGPVEGTVYQIRVTEGVDKDYWNRDKLKLQWVEDVNEGDVISLKYRSERDIYQWDIRDGSLKWVYESKKGSFTDPVLGEDGWYTLTYTFAKDINGADVDYPNEQFSVFFRGNFVTTDMFEIKDITLNGRPLAIEEDTIISAAELVDPAVDFDWSVKNYAVLFATGTPGEVDKTPIAEKVVAGGFVTGAPIAKEGYTLTIYNDTAHTSIFDPTTPITEEKIFYYEYVGVPRTVKFVTNSDSVIADVTVANGDMLVAPEEPLKEGEAFKAWYVDEALTTPWNFNDAVTGDMTLYAAYGEPVTVTFELNGGSFGEDVPNTKVVCVGNAVAMPDAPTNGTKMFLGWYADEEFTTPYVFSTPVTEAITIYANWINSTDITLYIGDAEPVTFKAALDAPLSEDDENLVVKDDLIGYVFDGWYTDATCETPYDFETVITAPLTLYGQWIEAPLYQLVATHGVAEGLYDFDKFELKYTDETVNAGDVISFRYRSTTEFTFFSVRDAKKWVYENSTATRGMDTYETKDDGWTYVTYTFTAKTYDGTADIPANATWKFHFGSRTIVVGDVLEIQDLTLNGKPLAVKPSSSYAAPTCEIVEGGAYEWTDVAVAFEVGENATAIEPTTVKFGGTIEEPALLVAEGYAFAGWYADEELTKEFDFALPIIKETTIYAKIGVARNVTFDAADDSEPAVVIVADGETVAEPADPAKDGAVFEGWFLADATEAYDFSTPVTEDITLTAHWLSSVKLRLNMNDGTDAFEAIDVEKEVAIDEPKDPSRAGFFFGGWYTEAACQNEFDFASGITADTDIYAKWESPTKEYKYTVTDMGEEPNDRIQFRFKSSNVPALGSLETGDTITFMMKSSATLGKVRVRNVSKVDGKYPVDQWYTLPEADGDGWVAVSIAIAADCKDGGGLTIGIYKSDSSSGAFDVNDTFEIKAVAINGDEIVLTESSSCGLYPSHSDSDKYWYGVPASLEIVNFGE